MKIIPAILPKSKEDLIEKLTQLDGVTDRVQIDLCDGVFVATKSWPFAQFDSTENMFRAGDAVADEIAELQALLGKFKIELDLMVSGAETLLSFWDTFHPDRVIFHVDSIQDDEALAISLGALHSLFPWVIDRKVGFAVSQNTDIMKLDSWYLSFELPFVQIMGVEPIGVQGSVFKERTLEIIEDVREKLPGVLVQIDGGITEEILPVLKKAGVEDAIMGSTIFATGTPSENFEKLQNIAS